MAHPSNRVLIRNENKLLPQETRCMNLANTMLSKRSQETIYTV